MQLPPLIFVLYDSTQNSIFAGQVLQPLIKKYKKNPGQKIILVSFERNSTNQLRNFISQESGIQLCILKKIPFIGRLSLHFASLQLKQLLAPFTAYEIIARGPLAGWICAQAMKKEYCASLTIQARGLLAEEYAYSHQDEKTFFKRIIHWWRTHQFRSIEQTVYKTYAQQYNTITIEAVSPALKEYLMQTLHTPKHRITIANEDIPSPLSKEQTTAWKTSVRNKLGIPLTTSVYCYNGSAKPWQCPEEIVIFFKRQYKKNPCSFLLILTQDIKAFELLLDQHEINSDSYRVLTVSHKDIYQYLSACDTGLLFRTHHIINWVSRPTKALEYRAAHLDIIHNNTVGYLTLTN